ncbi:hypothetical protein AAFF_G00389960 [Aldrovandia affinis]|uniref:Uncharacterized protein n=1 Tax=Aldrovandia affinis TaxID=143900 RepID=A0AAD7WM23_9TELE|nr:hypothetical protein AAFF_G00389960 [Aldrovandia affinis]
MVGSEQENRAHTVAAAAAGRIKIDGARECEGAVVHRALETLGKLVERDPHWPPPDGGPDFEALWTERWRVSP